MASNNKSIVVGAVAEIDLKGEQIPLLLMISSDNKVFLVIGSRRFEFSQLSEGFKASYKNLKGDAFNISELLGELIPSIVNELPGNLKVNLEQVIIAYQKQDSTKSSNKPGQSKDNSTLLLSTRLGFDINLAELPLIGDKIPTEIDFKLKSFQLTYVSQALNKASVQPFADDLNLNIAHITNDEQIVLTSGLNLCAELQVGSETQLLSLPLSRPQKKTPSKSQQQPSQNPKSPVPSDSKIAPNKSTSLSTNFGSEQIELWLELNKAIGAIAFQKIGVQYRPKESELWFFLNASLSIAGLTLACNNLGVGSSLSEFKPKFRLDGISIHYSGSNAVEIGGAFLRKIRTREDGINYEEYSGAAIIGTKIKDKKITLTAIGSYTEIDGEASLFIFALLDYPLGGPPIFFVTGLAAGFGYNRTLKVPETVEAVADFPLVRLAMGEKPSKSSEKAGEPDLLSILNDLGPYIPPARDEMFFAVGVKFTSFKTVEAFVLLIIKLGKKFEIHILGLATLTAPPMIEGVSDDIEPVAEARLAIRAVFIPDDGILKVEAVLAEGSYIFSRKCHLSGGFAFYTWFSGEHEGDFVLTLGGYHPDFKIPDHYPRVPPVQLSWRVNEYLFIKGSAYFALTPSALMVGGGLEASYQKANVQACFKIEANFLVAWQPFFYTADISVEIRASAKIKFIFEKTISLNIRASLSIWGPPFAGRAQFEIGPISIEIAFGDGSYPKPKALSWSEFQKSLLPAPEKVCSISISEGLIKKLGEGKQEIWIVNAKELVIVTESAIPSLCVEIADIKQDSISDISHPNTEIGIRPMGVKAQEFEATYKISVFRENTLVNQEFKYEPIYKNVPSAIWKASTGSLPYLPPEPNEEKLMKRKLCGFEIQPGAKDTPEETPKIAYEKLLSDCFNGSQYYWSQIYTPKSSENKDVISKNDVSSKAIMKLEQALEHKINDKRRQNLLNSLNFNCQQKDITISKSFAEELLGDPSLISLF
ncbi:MAG: DUF6603 domain-containing protein [Nostoc sp. ChiQUE02]|uniref:DUF6603 domain-containing protein n=1 Tax=Nostoc sp. ChiQUE02 TaxID=3075377 RepID=UPI002AD5170F|nr:DUF6603 domain-containing protein [Nostoc sp. ChiQUE02]MDZ8230242.1 hypothetical protein [Nostoc sp. ChiQUE02]